MLQTKDKSTIAFATHKQKTKTTREKKNYNDFIRLPIRFFSIASNNLHICSLQRTFIHREQERREKSETKKHYGTIDRRTNERRKNWTKRIKSISICLCFYAFVYRALFFCMSILHFMSFFCVTGADFTAWEWFFCSLSLFLCTCSFFNIYILRSILLLRCREANVKRRRFQRLRPINRWCVFFTLCTANTHVWIWNECVNENERVQRIDCDALSILFRCMNKRKNENGNDIWNRRLWIFWERKWKKCSIVPLCFAIELSARVILS